MKDKVVFILGPTAVGKSGFAVALAKKFDGEIISADSVQVFKGLNIGSAKIMPNEMQGIVHHGIDIKEPNDTFSAYEFVQFTKEKIKEIISRNKLPIVVGGTGLYVRSLTEGFNFGGVETSKDIREKLENLAQEKGNDFLFDMLQEKNVELAKNIDKFNTVRLVRALEIALSDGEKSKSESDIEPLVFALQKPREELYATINKRVDQMLDANLVGEVKKLLDEGVREDAQSMRAIGYKEVISFLKGEIDEARMVEQIKQHTRNYAKRQMTYLRTMKNVNFVDVSNKKLAEKEIFEKVEEFLR